MYGREGAGRHVHCQRGSFVGQGLPARGCCAVDRGDGEAALSICTGSGNGEALQEVAGIGVDLPVEAVVDGDGFVDRYCVRGIRVRTIDYKGERCVSVGIDQV